eukprot:352178-Chlamydomonas_euryale.AAC.14
MSGAGAGDQLVVYTDHGALALRTVDPEEERKAAEKRIEEVRHAMFPHAARRRAMQRGDGRRKKHGRRRVGPAALARPRGPGWKVCRRVSCRDKEGRAVLLLSMPAVGTSGPLMGNLCTHALPWAGGHACASWTHGDACCDCMHACRRVQALELEQKLKKINEEVPTRIYNTMSSTAGAGSGTFHQYRMVGFSYGRMLSHACTVLPCSFDMYPDTRYGKLDLHVPCQQVK